MLIESQLLKEWTKEEREEAAKETTIAILLELLEEKFDLVPERTKDRLYEIQDPDKLRSLAKKIIKVATLQEFEDFLVKKK